ncbi:MAG: guanylate kinase [Crocinitomicaceae bacterium]
MKKGKCIIFSAPSGAGKTTIVHHLLEKFDDLAFSISACSRAPRGNEIDGVDYHFIGLQQFKEYIDQDKFIEWEEVYSNHYYGTLKDEIMRIWDNEKAVVFDVDVIGGLNLKKFFGEDALAIFVQPPSLDVLEERLRSRATESDEKIKQRMAKAKREIAKAHDFDVILVNNKLENAFKEAEELVSNFLAE